MHDNVRAISHSVLTAVLFGLACVSGEQGGALPKSNHFKFVKSVASLRLVLEKV